MFKVSKNFVKSISTYCCSLLGFFVASCPVMAEVVSTSEFETAAREYPWTNFTNVDVSELSGFNAGPGMGLSFFFKGSGAEEDSFAEARFALDRAYLHLIINFDMFVPANYVHRDTGNNSDNNKFFRLWLNDYGDQEKLGASLRGSGGESLIGTDYSLYPTWGTSTTIKTRAGFISESDKGQWLTVKLDVVAPTDSSMGSISIYKNGELFLQDEEVPNLVLGQQGYQKGYLLGWANSGFSTDTYILIDNVRFIDGETDNSPPSPPVLKISR
jgi:hypothetical protein